MLKVGLSPLLVAVVGTNTIYWCCAHHVKLFKACYSLEVPEPKAHRERDPPDDTD